MLHMLVSTHTPEDCAFRGKVEEELLAGGYDAFEKKAAEQGFQVLGSWVNRSIHETFLVVDAPNAHVIEVALVESGLLPRTSSRILPVVSTDDAIPER